MNWANRHCPFPTLGWYDSFGQTIILSIFIMKFLLKLNVVLFVLITRSISALAQTDIYISGAESLIPIALPQLCVQSGESSGAKDIPRAIGRDLDLSSYFKVISENAYIESPGKCGDSVVYSDWSVIGAAGVVRGVIQSYPTGIKVQLYLHEVGRQAVVLAKEYQGDSSQLTKMAHRFANEIMKYYTGQSGPFGTQIAFSSRVGRFKDLFVMDMDGSNIRQLTNDRGLALSAAWSPSGRSVVYTSYRTRVPDLFIMDVDSRSVRQVTRSPALEVGAHFTPSGSELITSVTTDAGSDLVLLNSDGGLVRRVTEPNGAIDVSPSYSPDGSQLAFCSNRGGGPQIYVMGSDGSGAHRVSFVSSNYCTSPSWSPKGDKIAFVCRADGGFNIFTTGVNGGSALQLTSYGNNEDPDWSPDGRYLVFSSTMGGGGAYSLALMRYDGAGVKQLTKSRGGDFEPTWGPILP